MARESEGSSMNINLNIDHLLLEGISIKPHQRAELKATVESALSRYLSSQDTDPCLLSDVSRSTVRGGTIDIKESSNPSVIGQQIAEVIYKGIKG